jgi:RimJ/RimL family protein N-acetyltransferase
VGWGPNTEEDTKNFVRRVLALQSEGLRTVYSLAVVTRDHNVLIGGCRISIVDERHREGSIGYILNKKYWGRGFGTELARALLNFGFEKLTLHRIYATCDIANAASAHVMEKNGMLREGCLREYRLQGNKWGDEFIYSVLDHEWIERKTDKP